MDASIRTFIGARLDAARVDASFDFMGVDTQLVEDGTYFVVECGDRIAGCGGWSRRATMFGGDHSAGRDARLLDPASEPAPSARDVHAPGLRAARCRKARALVVRGRCGS